MSEQTKQTIEKIEREIDKFLVNVNWLSSAEIEKINKQNETIERNIIWQFGTK